MKTFTLYFDSSDSCDSLDKSWFGEMWFPVQKSMCQAHTALSQATIPDQADLDMDSARSFEVTVNLAVGKEKAKCWRNEVYAQERAHPLLPLGRLTNLLDTKFVWENGDSGHAMQR